MPITADRDDARRLVVAHVVGPLLMSELFAFASDHRTGLPSTYALLLDLREATTMPTEGDLRSFAHLLAMLSRSAVRGRAALLAPTDSVFEASRALEQFCQAAGVHTLRACRDVEEADAWLAVAKSCASDNRRSQT